MNQLAKNPKEKKESLLLSIILNIALPSLVLTKFSSPDKLGPLYGLLVGLSFPFIYGIYDFISRRNFNLISVLGIVSTGLTGGFSLMKLDNHWIAVKEAAIPFVIGVFILGSILRNKPMIKTFLYKPEIIKVDKIESILEKNDTIADFDKLLNQSTLIFAVSFFVSSILNYVLAKIILISSPGSEAFNQELGKMTMLSYPVIVIPSTLVLLVSCWHLIKGVKRLTGLTLEEVVNSPAK